MKGIWWKALSVLILIYVIIAGMCVPLKPGIVRVAPDTAASGDTLLLSVTGYNSFYSRADSLRAWLKTEEEFQIDDPLFLAASRIRVRDDRRLDLRFDIPEFLPSSSAFQGFTLVLDSEVDGPSVLPGAVFLRQDSIQRAAGIASWSQDTPGSFHLQEGFTFPFRNILAESIRNTYFHVPLWFAMLFILLASVIFSVRYLINKNPVEDLKAISLARVGVWFGILGLVTGAIWAKNTWGAYWSFDVKQNMTAVALLIYLAYFILRAAFEDREQKARLSAVYNLFAFAALIPLLYVIPRMTDSLHPGAGGNPALGGEDLDNTMRMVFYPAIIGWTLLGVWMAQLHFRTVRLEAWLSGEEDEDFAIG